MLNDILMTDSVWHSKDFNLRDLGIKPKSLGSYFLLHRLDGNLVGMSSITIAKKYLESSYFAYDTDYKFLNLGVMSVIREMEYLNFLRKHHFPDL